MISKRNRTQRFLSPVALILGWVLAWPGPVSAEEGVSLRLVPDGSYRSGIFGGSAAEIVAQDPIRKRLYVTNAEENRIDVIDASIPSSPTLVFSIDLSDFGAGVNSVAVHDGLVAIAVDADPITDPGACVITDPDGVLLASLEIGALPDMLTFSADGSLILVACEGEPDGATGVDPVGAVAIVDVSGGAASATVTLLELDEFDARTEELRAKGIRIFPGKSAGEDLEPEYISISPDGTTAFVTLQEGNAFAVVDLATKAFRDVIPLGLKNHEAGRPVLQNYPFPEMPLLSSTATVNPSDPSESTPGEEILLGGFSGLWFEGVDPISGELLFVTHPDRGPNGEPTNVDADATLERPFALPDYQARIVRFSFDEATGEVTLGDTLLLTRSDGVTPITGLPNIPVTSVDEEPTDLFGNILEYDAFGADLEGIAIDTDGSYWLCDEYRPAVYHFGTDGALIDRFVPEGTAALAGELEGALGSETIPAAYAKRRQNRGFEAIAIDPQNERLFAFIQTPLANPNRAASDNSDSIRIIVLSTADGSAIAEYIMFLEAPDFRDTKVDKVGDAVYLGADRLAVVVRDDTVASYGKKYIWQIDLAGATDLLDPSAPALLAGKTLEQHTVDDLIGLGIFPVDKLKLGNIPSLGYEGRDKVEGLALISDERFAILNDNDFRVAGTTIAGDGTIGLDPDAVGPILGIIEFDGGWGLDPSDRDSASNGGVNIASWPVFGIFMPDAIDSFELDGDSYWVTANEGDTRTETARIGSRALDPDVFPDAADLKANAALGRLDMSTIDGDVDDDGDYDRLQVIGARSFSVWDRFGNLVSDSGESLEQITAELLPADFNSTSDENGSFDTRSDNKGPEPEALEVTSVFGHPFAFVGLERIGGVAAYDLAEPATPAYHDYLNTRDFAGVPADDTAGDLSPEGLAFIDADASAYLEPLLAVGHEVSGSTALYRVLNGEAQFDLRFATLFEASSASDGEVSLAGVLALPAGVNTGDLSAEGSVSLDLGGDAAFTRETLEFTSLVLPFGFTLWTLADGTPPEGTDGCSILWRSANYSHGSVLTPFRLRSVALSRNAATLNLRIRGNVSSPLTLDLDGRGSVTFTPATGIATATGDATVAKRGNRNFDITLSFPLLPSMGIEASGAAPESLSVADGLRGAAGTVLFQAEVAGLGDAIATSAVDLDLELRLGLEGNPGVVRLGAGEFFGAGGGWLTLDE